MTGVVLPPLAAREQVLTLGGLRPGSIVCIVAGDGQLWWKPCLHRSESGTDTHAWYLAPTSDGSIHCWDCRRRAPRIVMGRADAITEIRKALELGNFALVEELIGRLSWTTAPHVVGLDVAVAQPVMVAAPEPCIPVPARAFTPRDHADWNEYYQERAAIFEYLGGIPRAEAEISARELAGPAPRYAAAGPLFAGAT